MLEIIHDLAPQRRARLRHRGHQRRVVRRQHPRPALRRGLRHHRRRRPLLQRGPVPGRPDRPGGQRGHRRRRALLQLGRQRGQHARRHVRQLRGRLRRLGPVGVGKFAGEAHDFDPGAGVQVFEPISDDVERRRAGHAVLGRPARRTRPTTTTSTCSTPTATSSTSRRTSRTARRTRSRSSSRRRSAGRAAPGRRQVLRRGAVLPAHRAARPLRGLGRRARRACVTPGVTRGHSAAVERVQRRRRAGRRPAAVRPRAGRPAEPERPVPERRSRARQKPERFTSDGPRRVFFTPTARRSRRATSPRPAGRCGRSRTSPPPTASARSVDGLHARSSAPRPPRRTPRRSPRWCCPATRARRPPRSGSAFNATALDLAPAGVDNRTGHGILRADRVLAYTGATPQPLVRRGSPTVTPTAGDGDAFLEPGETATAARCRCTNVGDGTATGVSVRLVTRRPAGHDHAARHASYGDIAAARPSRRRSRSRWRRATRSASGSRSRSR